MSRGRIDTHQLLKALANETEARGRPITAAALAAAYHTQTGHTFNSDSLTRHLFPHLRNKTVTRNKGRYGQYQYAPARKP